MGPEVFAAIVEVVARFPKQVRDVDRQGEIPQLAQSEQGNGLLQVGDLVLHVEIGRIDALHDLGGQSRVAFHHLEHVLGVARLVRRQLDDALGYRGQRRNFTDASEKFLQGGLARIFRDRGSLRPVSGPAASSAASSS